MTFSFDFVGLAAGSGLLGILPQPKGEQREESGSSGMLEIVSVDLIFRLNIIFINLYNLSS